MEFLVSLAGREGDQRAVPAGPQASAHPSAVVPTPSLALQPSRQCDELPNFLLKPPLKRHLFPAAWRGEV